MRVGARASGQQIRRCIAPDDPRGHASGNHRCRSPGRVERGAGLGRAADRTGAIMGASAALIVSGKAALAAMADRRCAQGIAGGNRCRPCHADRCEDLHNKRDQDDRQELLKASTHQGHPDGILFRPSRSITPQQTPHAQNANYSRSCCPNDASKSAGSSRTILPSCCMQFAKRWPISNHFGKCSKFEQSLPKMVTSCTI